MDATNTVTLVAENVVHARDILVPLGIAAVVLFVGFRAGLKFWNGLFSSNEGFGGGAKGGGGDMNVGPRR